MQTKSSTYVLIFKAFPILLMCTLSLLGVNTVSAAYSGDGTGVVGDPYQITSCAQLTEVSDNVNRSLYFLLKNDLDCASIGNAVMMCDQFAPFTGNFNGGGHTITVDINIGLNNVGVFRNINGGTVTDLRIAGSITGASNVGGIAGEVTEDGTLARVVNTAKVQGSSTLGGVVGDLWSGSVTDSYNTGDVTGTGSSVGGFAGMITNASISRSYSRGKVTAVSPPMGSFVAYMQGSPSIHDSFSVGRVYMPGYNDGGFTGYVALMGNSSLVNNYWDSSRTTKTVCGLDGDNADVVGSGHCEAVNNAWGDTNVLKNNSINGPFSAWDFTPDTGVWQTVEGGYPALQSIANDELAVSDNEGAPSVPIGLHVTSKTSDSVSFEWNAPEQDGYHEILGYTILASIHGEDTWNKSWTMNSLSTEFPLLDPLTNYDFKIYATNSQGESVRSEIVTAETDAILPPEKPSVTVSPNILSAYVNWEVVSQGAGVSAVTIQDSGVTGCTIQYRVVETESWLPATIDESTPCGVGGSAGWVKITNLHANTTYDVRMSVTNAGGESSMSDIDTITTKDFITDANTWNDGLTVMYVGWNDEGTERTVDYGTTTDYGLTVDGHLGEGMFARLEDLSQGTLYYYRINVTYPDDGVQHYTGTFTTEAEGYPATDEVGQAGEGDTPNFEGSDSNSDAFGFSNQSGVAVDSIHHRLFVADGGGDGTYNNRVLVFNLNESNTLQDHEADYVLGQETMTDTNSGNSASQMNKPRNVTYDGVHDRLFVSDGGNHRVLVFAFSESNPLSSGMDATYVLGQSAFNQSSHHLTQTGLYNPMGMTYDRFRDKLYVAEMGNYRVVLFDVRPSGSETVTMCGTETTGIATGMKASCVLGQTDFLSDYTEPDQYYLGDGPRDVAIDPYQEVLYVADSESNRIVAYDVRNSGSGNKELCEVTTNGLVNDGEDPMPASCVLGQDGDFSATEGDTTSDTFSTPRGLWFDDANDRLIVADLGNNRVLFYDQMSHMDSDTSATAVIGQKNFNSDNDNDASRFNLACPNAVTYDNTYNRLYVSDACNNRVMMYDMPYLNPAPIPNGVKGTPYTTTLQMMRTESPFVMYANYIEGALPDGLELLPNGIISGTPTETGTFYETVLGGIFAGDMGVFLARHEFIFSVSEGTIAPPIVTPTATPTVTRTITTKTTTDSTPEVDELNVVDGQLIAENPYVITYKPVKDGVTKVEFYIDDILICSVTEPDADGVYSCAWDTSKYHSILTVYTYDAKNVKTLAQKRTTTVSIFSPTPTETTAPTLLKPTTTTAVESNNSTFTYIMLTIIGVGLFGLFLIFGKRKEDKDKRR